jgi:hypothetical protein
LLKSASPYINRFLSADTIVPGYANPQNLNRYSYTLNNPVRYIDPTGHKVCEDYGGTCLSENQVTQLSNNVQNVNVHDDNNEDGEFCDPILGCEDPEVGVFCDQVSCWYDAGTDISWTLEDWPTITAVVAVPCFLTGLCETVGAAGSYACLQIAFCARILASTTGITVYRVWGGYSGSAGSSWTPINPMTISNYANQAGLPLQNFGQYLSVGTVYSMDGIQIVTASPIGNNVGGLLEYVIANPQVQVVVQEVQYLIPALNH